MTVSVQYQTHAFQKQQKMAGRKRMFGSAVSMLTGGFGGAGLSGLGGGSLGGGYTGTGF